MSKTRLDQRVFDLGLAESREKAKAIIMSGAVYLNGQKADKPGMSVPADCLPEVRGETLKYVSRGGLKLELAWKLRQDPRVVNLERCNLRYLTAEQVPDPLDIAVMDVSFISIRLILPVIRQFLKPGADYICLIKPQFEAGREQVGKKGVVRDAAVHRSVIETCLNAAREAGYSVMGLDWSPIRGPEGNIEFLAWLVNAQREEPVLDISAVVEAAHGGKL